MGEGEGGRKNTKQILHTYHTCHSTGRGLRQSLIISKDNFFTWCLLQVHFSFFQVLY